MILLTVIFLKPDLDYPDVDCNGRVSDKCKRQYRDAKDTGTIVRFEVRLISDDLHIYFEKTAIIVY